MLAEHKRLKILLEGCLKNSAHSPILAEEFFVKFKWNLEKHFFLEEKVIFSNPAVENSEHTEEIDDILKEHKEILEIVRSIELDKFGLNEEKLKLLKKIVEKHAQFEDEDFYPRLDEILTQEQKQEIFRESRKVLQA